MVKKRHYPIGAEWHVDGVDFRVWAPNCQHVDLILEEGSAYSLEKEERGYFSLFVKSLSAGQNYQFRLDQGSMLYPDPASRYQPSGPFGPSCIMDPTSFSWQAQAWQGVCEMRGQVLYELHVGTFTQEGTWNGATQRLGHLAELGVTLIELMPIAEFPGKFGWGYDGVNLFAPSHLYGTPDAFKSFIDQAHALGMGVILDVVYNHFGPDGNFIGFFSEDYFSQRYKTEWGKALNFDGKNSGEVRAFFLTNALYWMQEFHLDGFRIDATQNIYDASEMHILKELHQTLLQKLPEKKWVLIAENECQHIKLVKEVPEGGYGLDAVWNDDFHHTVIARLTGRKEAYYTDYQGSLQEMLSAIKYGFLYQGQYYTWQKQNRGTPSLDIPYHKFVLFLQNHDQVANLLQGKRIEQSSDPGLLRALTALFLLAPQTPLLFQGQEFGTSSPFYYFADQNSRLNKFIWEGRKIFLAQFPSTKSEEMADVYPDPSETETFEKCKLDWEEKSHRRNSEIYALHRDLLKLRRSEALAHTLKIDGAILTPDLLLIRYFGKEHQDHLLLCNLGIDYALNPIPEPLFAPPKNCEWSAQFSSQNPLYGGSGTPSEIENRYFVPGHCALLFKTKRVLP